MKKLLAAFALVSAPVSLAAQAPDSATMPDTAEMRDTAGAEWVPIGSPAEDRLRTAQLLGEAPSAGFLLRSVSSYAAPREAEGRVHLLRPHVRAVYNTYLPVSANQGMAWTGRGAGFHALAGVRARFGRVTVIAAPEVAYTQNRDFQRIPSPAAEGRSQFAHPYHGRISSLDTPLRFGDDPMASVSLGQSSVTVNAGAWAAGAATESLWWGPGMRNALLMSNNAPGFPHLFVRTSPEGLRTRFGTLRGRWVAGALSQSSYFDGDDEGRTIAALALAFTPRGEPGLT
ncbi:MAG TPA: capsule assembly Wzi family protein, partial [Longimicrobium sp.]